MTTAPSRRKLRPEQSTAPMTTACVALTRSSTVEQLLTHGAQSDSIGNYTRYKGIRLDRVFDDRGTGGKETFLQRPVVIEALRYMQAHGLDTMVCTRFDRFFRDLLDAILTLDTLYQAGIFLHFCENNVDPSTPMGRAMFQFMGMLAELETGMRSVRQLEAFDQQRKLGQKSGVNAPYGHREVASPSRKTRQGRPATDLTPHPEQQQVLGCMVRLRREGADDRRIAAVLNAAGIPTAKAGQMITWRGVTKLCSGQWSEATVFSVLSFARLADPRLASSNADDVEDAMRELRDKSVPGSGFRVPG